MREVLTTRAGCRGPGRSRLPGRDPGQDLQAPAPSRPPTSGPAPVTRRSGSSIRGERVCRTGNKRLKHAMFLSAFASLRDPVSRTYYQRKRDQGKRHNQALLALAHRRIPTLHAMTRNQPRNHPQPLDTPHRGTPPAPSPNLSHQEGLGVRQRDPGGPGRPAAPRPARSQLCSSWPPSAGPAAPVQSTGGSVVRICCKGPDQAEAPEKKR